MTNPTKKRPTDSDQGQQVWVLLLPGTHPSPLKAGILESWNQEDMQLQSGESLAWDTVVDWGIGDPPRASEVY